MSTTQLETPALIVSSPTQPSPPQASDSDSDDANTPPATPIFQPSALHPDPTVLLMLTSHAYAPPLQPPPDLQYDLRAFPSAGAEKYASRYDGRGKRAREWVRGEGGYVELLGEVEGAVVRRGRELEVEAEREREENEKKVALSAEEEAKAVVTEATEKPEVELAEKTETLVLGQAEEEDHPAAEATTGTPPKILRVGVSSEMGRDRSVAFVEELSRRKWPVEWAVEVLHRDVDKQRGLRKGKARGGEKGGRRKNLRGGDFANEE